MRRSKVFWLVALAGAALCGAPETQAGPADLRCKVLRLSDGDTFVARQANGRTLDVRLWGVDAPESKQRYGLAAERFVESLIDGRTVTVRPITRDDYGRTVAIVVLDDGRLLQEALIDAGLAWVYRRYTPRSREAEWLPIERDARDGRRGLWADSDPTPPWRWRQTH